jgi:cytochrome P450
MEVKMNAKITSSNPDRMSSLPSAHRHIADLAGPRAWPLIGNVAQIDVTRLHTQLEDWARRYGPLYRIKLGVRDVVVVANPNLISSILRDRPEGWRRLQSMQTVIREMGGHGLFSAEGEDWMRQRRLAMSAFDPGHLKNFFPSLLRSTERLKNALDREVQRDNWIDLQSTLTRYTVDVVAGLAFGIDINSQEHPDQELLGHLDAIFPMLMRRVNAAIPLWRYVKLPADRAFDRHLAAVHAAVRSYIQMARDRIACNPDLQENPENLLEAMLTARDDQEGRLSEEELVGNVLTVLLAGQDTTAHTMCWTLYLLHVNRPAWQDLVSEIDGSLGDDPMPSTFDATRNLDVVDQCLKESMRLRTVAPLLFLENNRETELDGIALPKGTPVMCVMRSGSVDAETAPDATEFRPARWWRRDSTRECDRDRSDTDRALLKASMPFGAGPRICPGRYLSMLEMKMVLSTLARNYDLVHVGTEDASPPQERMDFAMHPVGLRMKLKSRA